MPVSAKRFRVALLSALLILTSTLSVVPASAAASINGTLSNFDTFNDTGIPAHGFEIELEGVHAADVQYFFGAPYNRYGTPSVLEFNDGTRWGTKVRWESTFDPTNGYASTTALAPANPTPTNAHECYLGGPAGSTQALYDSSGCEHFGIGMYGNPVSTTYQWLVDDGTNTGKLTYANSPVNIPAVTWQANSGNVAAVVPALPPAPVAALPAVPDCSLWGTATWMKIYVTEAGSPAQLGNLLTGDSDVPQELSQVETEWQFLQGRPTCDSDGKPLAAQPDNELVNQAPAGGGSESVTRRYEFYAYIGAYDDTDGGNHEALPLCDSDPFKASCGAPAQAQPNGDLGAYQGAQMVAANLIANGIVAPTLSLTKSGDGSGLVSDGNGLSCGDLCGGAYAQNAQVTLTATPDAGSHIAGWSIPSCGVSRTCTVTMTSDTSVNAEFALGDAPVPSISSFSPSQAVAGSRVVLTGSAFTADSEVSINGVAASVLSATGNTLTLVVPCGAGKGVITVKNAGGSAHSASTFSEVVPVTKVTTIAPSIALSGATVAISGTGLLCTKSVSVGVAAASFSAISQSSLRFTVPEQAVNDTVRIGTVDGRVVTGPRLTIAKAPEISGVSPLHAFPGATVTVTGRNLTSTTKLLINGLNLSSIKFLSPTQMTGVLPANSATGAISVSNAYGAAAFSTDFVIDVRKPTVTQLTPNKGGPGTAVTVKGANFQPGMSAWLHGNPVTVNYITSTSAVVVIPSNQTSGTLVLQNSAGSATSTVTFTVSSTLTAPKVTKVSSVLVSPLGVVTVTGTNLGAASRVSMAGVVAKFTVKSAGVVSVTVPDEATTSGISITTPGGTVTTPQITVD